MTKDDAQLYSPAIMLIAHLRRKGQTQGYYEHAVEMALNGLQHNSPGRYTRDAVDEPKDSNPPPPQEKQAKKKKPDSPTVQQSGNPTDQSGQGAAQSSGAGSVQEGGNAPGRGDPTGTTMTPGGAVTSPTPTGPGRADQQ